MKELPVTSIPVSYVESDDFRVIHQTEIGCRGRRLLLREYRLKASPDQRPSNDISHTLASLWAEAGYPDDAVFHVGPFYRVTNIATKVQGEQ